MKKEITIKVNIKDGYEATGEYRPPLEGEYYLTDYGITSRAVKNFAKSDGNRIILRKVHKMPEITHYMSIETGEWTCNDELDNWRPDEIKKRITELEFQGVTYDMFLMEYNDESTYNVCLGHYNDGPKEK